MWTHFRITPGQSESQGSFCSICKQVSCLQFSPSFENTHSTKYNTGWWRLVEVGTGWWRLVDVCGGMWYRLVRVTRLCMESDITRIYPTTPSDQAACPRVVRPRQLKKRREKKCPRAAPPLPFLIYLNQTLHTLSRYQPSHTSLPPPLVLHHSPLPRLLLLFISKRQILPIHNFSSSSPHLHAG